MAATVAQGVHGRRRTGTGEAFWQFRAYQAGDEPKSIDWRQSAKGAHIFVRQQEWEAAESVWLWVDSSPSMHFRSTDVWPRKHERALILILALATLLVRGGERIVALGSGGRPRSGRLGLVHFAQSLLEAFSRNDVRLPPPDRLPRFARIVLISDFLEPLHEIRDSLAAFTANGATGAVLQVTDPAEEELPYAGRVLFQGLEREGTALVRNVDRTRSSYQKAFFAQRQGLQELASRQGWRFAAHRTDRSAESGLLALYQMLAPKAVR